MNFGLIHRLIIYLFFNLSNIFFKLKKLFLQKINWTFGATINELVNEGVVGVVEFFN